MSLPYQTEYSTQHKMSNSKWHIIFMWDHHQLLYTFNFLKTQPSFITHITLLPHMEMEKLNFRLENASTVQEQQQPCLVWMAGSMWAEMTVSNFPPFRDKFIHANCISWQYEFLYISVEIWTATKCEEYVKTHKYNSIYIVLLKTCF
jgi:hypothetical protein